MILFAGLGIYSYTKASILCLWLVNVGTAFFFLLYLYSDSGTNFFIWENLKIAKLEFITFWNFDYCSSRNLSPFNSLLFLS